MTIPYSVDVPMTRFPWANWAIIGITILFYPLCVTESELTPLGEALAFTPGNLLGWVGCVLVHADWWHLGGNLLFLFVFGNAICAKVGNWWYPLLYVALAFLSSFAGLLDGYDKAVGASGAINGVVGIFLIWYVRNDVACFYALYRLNRGGTGTFRVSSGWIILLWAVFDVYGLLVGESHVGHAAHLGGLISGMLIGLGLLLTGWIKMEDYERSLLDLFAES